MMNKNLLAVLFLVSGSLAQANLQEKLAAKAEKINIAKQNVKAGKPTIANERCQKCGNKCQQA